MQPVIFPSSFILVSSAASTVTGILGLTTSTAASGATFGLAMPQAWATFTVFSNDMYLVLQGRIGHEGHVREEQKLFDAGNVEHAHMGKRIAGPKAHFLVQNAL